MKNCLITDLGYTQLVTQYTTDYHTQIDHFYTNEPQLVQSAGTGVLLLAVMRSLSSFEVCDTAFKEMTHFLES